MRGAGGRLVAGGFAAATAFVVFLLPLRVPMLGIAAQLGLLAGLAAGFAAWSLIGLEPKAKATALREAGLAVALVLASTGLLEIAARAVTYRADAVISHGVGLLFYDAEPFQTPGRFGDLTPQRSVWTILEERPYAVTVDTSGLRSEAGVDWESPRILCVGDSFTFGPYVANADTWPALLADELGRQGHRLQVLNAGVAGYTIAQEAEYALGKGLALKPSLVILGYFVNDVGDLAAAKTGIFSRPAERADTLWRLFKRRSALMQIGLRWGRERAIGRARAGGDGDSGAARSEDQLRAAYADEFRGFAERLRQARIPLAVLAFPSFDLLGGDCATEEIDFIRGLARAESVPVLDLSPPFRAHRIEDLYLLRYDSRLPPASGCFPDRSRYVGNKHLSRFGYQVTARAAAEFLGEHGLVPKS